MKICKKELIEVYTSNGELISEGDILLISAYGRCLIGKYKEMNRRGSLVFSSLIEGEPDYVVTPKIVNKIQYLKVEDMANGKNAE